MRIKCGNFFSDLVIKEIQDIRSLKIWNIIFDNLLIVYLGNVNEILNNGLNKFFGKVF